MIYMGTELRIAVCDDEKYFRDCIKKKINEHLMKKNILFYIDVFCDGKEFCQNEDNFYNYDVIFLDIDMAHMNGMDTAYFIREKNENVQIVFITVMMEYVFQGYHVDALRFIMKNELDKLLPECLNVILQNRQFSKQVMRFSFIGGEREILLDEVLYIESKLHKLCFMRKGEVLYLYGKLDQLEEKLSGYGFIRTHQSFLVNLEHIEKIGNYQIHLTDGTQLTVVKSRYPAVKEEFLRHKEKI